MRKYGSNTSGQSRVSSLLLLAPDRNAISTNQRGQALTKEYPFTAQFLAALHPSKKYQHDMSDVVTLLKPLTDKLPWWALVSIAVPVTIGFLVKWYWSSYWSIRNLMVETKLKEDELEERNKKKAETAALKEQKPPLSNVSDYPKFEPVSTKAWFLFTALAIFNFLALVPVSLSEPLTTLKAALILGERLELKVHSVICMPL